MIYSYAVDAVMLYLKLCFLQLSNWFFLALCVMSEVSVVGKLVDQTRIESNTVVVHRNDQERTLEMLYHIGDH